ncbi:hypothetical protein ABPG74_000692 [Tetrahymena malaccensis]
MQGIQNRIVGQTRMGECSSRSHFIFSVTIERCVVFNGENQVKVGKLNLVDLAGSENQSNINTTYSRFKEAAHINLSLSTLANVISSLVDPKATYIPYRDSKLTRILQDSLGGNTKTVMIVNIGPSDFSCDETISTLRCAHKAKSIQNRAIINLDPKQALTIKFQDEICSLKQQLSGFLESGRDINLNGEVKKLTQLEDIVIKYNDEEIKQLKKKFEQQKHDIQSNYENEVKKIDEDKQLKEKEKQQLIQQLQANKQKQQQSNQQQQKLLDKLYKMQNKVIQGEETIKNVIENERQLNKELQQVKERDCQTTQQIQQNEDFIEFNNLIGDSYNFIYNYKKIFF